jgi:hypothetical protein
VLPDEVIEFVARQVKVPASDMWFSEWSERNEAALGATLVWLLPLMRQH